MAHKPIWYNRFHIYHFITRHVGDIKGLCFFLTSKGYPRYEYHRLSPQGSRRQAQEIIEIAAANAELGMLVFYLCQYWLDEYAGPPPTLLHTGLAEQLMLYAEECQDTGDVSRYQQVQNILNIISPLRPEERPVTEDVMKGLRGFHPQLQTSSVRRIVESHPGEVEFVSFSPREGKVDTWHTLLVYICLITALGDIAEDATRFEDKLPAPKQVSSSASTQIARGTQITIVPSCEGVEFNPPRMTIKWMEDYHRADFRFRADSSLLDDAAKGCISFFVGPVIVGTLKFAMLFHDKSGTSVLEPEDISTMYHSDRIFISYSHKDAEVALIFRNVLEATGYEVLIDVDDLRSGQIWNDELLRMIERADIFQLFWSVNSSQSEYCRKEWEHALKQNKGEGFIRPVYWQTPLPPPPEELSKYHFDYVELKKT